MHEKLEVKTANFLHLHYSIQSKKLEDKHIAFIKLINKGKIFFFVLPIRMALTLWGPFLTPFLIMQGKPNLK